MISPHRTRSAAMNFAVALTSIILTWAPSFSNFAFTSSSFRMSIAVVFNFCMIASGVPFGAVRVNQVTEVKSGMPDSRTVGTSGRDAERSELQIPRIRNSPPECRIKDEPRLSKAHRPCRPYVLERWRRAAIGHVHHLGARQLIAMDDKMKPLFRDVLDHAKSVEEDIDSLREILAFVIEATMMAGQAQKTEIARRLAAWAAILAVPTAVAGSTA
jgi:hypothetical protein